MQACVHNEAAGTEDHCIEVAKPGFQIQFDQNYVRCMREDSRFRDTHLQTEFWGRYLVL